MGNDDAGQTESHTKYWWGGQVALFLLSLVVLAIVAPPLSILLAVGAILYWARCIRQR